MNLSDIRIGEKGKIKSIKISGNMRRRLLDIGITDGTEIECVFKSPFGEPTAFLIKGAVIALRNEQCDKITRKLSSERVS